MILLSVLTAGGAVLAARQTAQDVDTLRARLESRYDVVPLRDAIVLQPKNRRGGIRMIEVSEGNISIDGAQVSGRELRDRIGDDADVVIRLSYLDAAQRRAFLRQPEERPAPPPEPPPPASERTPHRRVGERVRVFGDVSVGRDEMVDGQAIAVLGSVRVDGRVADQVVAVLGSVTLGSDAVVDGDVVAVGGRVHRAEGAEIHGRITEVNFMSPEVGLWRVGPWWGGPFMFVPFSGTARFFGTVFRLFLLGLLASVVLLIVREPVERVGRRIRAEPIKMAVIGVLAELLFVPALALSVVILAISIIGIPLLLFVPFLVVAALLVLVGGFASAAYVLGGWAADRAGWDAEGPYLRMWLGVAVVLAPLLVARLFGIVGGPFHVVAFMIAMLAIMFEYIVWTMGFGAALSTAFESWRVRRAPAVPPPPPTT